MKNVMVILGSVREGRAGEAVAKWVVDNLASNSEVNIDFADLKKIVLPHFNAPGAADDENKPELYPEPTKWSKRVAKADGFIIVNAEYNHGYTGVLKNALDWVGPGWVNKPVAFVSYGGESGGIRSTEQLIQVVIELGMKPLKSQVHIPYIWQAMENGKPKSEHNQNALNRLLPELIEMIKK